MQWACTVFLQWFWLRSFLVFIYLLFRIRDEGFLGSQLPFRDGATRTGGAGWPELSAAGPRGLRQVPGHPVGPRGPSFGDRAGGYLRSRRGDRAGETRPCRDLASPSPPPRACVREVNRLWCAAQRGDGRGQCSCASFAPWAAQRCVLVLTSRPWVAGSLRWSTLVAITTGSCTVQRHPVLPCSLIPRKKNVPWRVWLSWSEHCL